MKLHRDCVWRLTQFVGPEGRTEFQVVL